MLKAVPWNFKLSFITKEHAHKIKLCTDMSILNLSSLPIKSADRLLIILERSWLQKGHLQQIFITNRAPSLCTCLGKCSSLHYLFHLLYISRNKLKELLNFIFWHRTQERQRKWLKILKVLKWLNCLLEYQKSSCFHTDILHSKVEKSEVVKSEIKTLGLFFSLLAN